MHSPLNTHCVEWLPSPHGDDAADSVLTQTEFPRPEGGEGEAPTGTLTTILQRSSAAPTGSHADPTVQPSQPGETEAVPKLVLTLADVTAEKKDSPSATNMISY